MKEGADIYFRRAIISFTHNFCLLSFNLSVLIVQGMHSRRRCLTGAAVHPRMGIKSGDDISAGATQQHCGEERGADGGEEEDGGGCRALLF